MLVAGLLLLLGVGVDVAPTPPPTIQQQFDQASTAFDAGDWSGALATLGVLEQRLSNKNRRSLLIVQLRKGVALTHVQRFDEATVYLRDALRQLPPDDASLRSDISLGWRTLGQVDTLNCEFETALEDFRRAEAAAVGPPDVLAALIGQARLQAFLDPAESLPKTDRAMAILATLPKPDKDLMGQLRTIKGRALLNDRQYPAAKRELLAAVAELGGLTRNVNISDIAARSDLAIASLLTGDHLTAKKYLAYSGSGNQGNGEDGFARGTDMEPPDCGNDTGLRPDDVAVIEFGIGEDGTVGYAMPVYASRPGPAVAEFAKTVSRWSWSPDKLAKIPFLFRMMTRLELRCSNTHTRPTIASIMDGGTRRWLSEKGQVTPPLSGVTAADLRTLRSELARREASAGANALTLAPILLDISRNDIAAQAERQAAAVRLRDILLANGPSPSVRASVQASPILDFDQIYIRSGSFYAGSRRKRVVMIKQAETFLADPAIAADTAALNALRLRIADAYINIYANDQADPLIEAITTDGRLSAHDAIRTGALLRRSSLALARHDIQAARTAYEATGLSDTQCALVDASPTIVKNEGRTADFPDDAVRWGISGWAMTEFDVTASGTTANIRTIVAYPPFVFGTPTEKIYQRTRFQQSYRPQGGLGCNGQHASQGFTVRY